MTLRERLAPSARALLLGTAAGLLASAVLGHAPWEVLHALVSGAVGSPAAWKQTLAAAVPLVATALAMAIPARAGLFNIGGEGQLVLGGLAAGIVAAVASPSLALPAALLAGTAAGALGGAVAGFLRARWEVHEVLSTILLNFVLAGVAAWVLRWNFVHAGGDIPQTAMAAASLDPLLTLALVAAVAVAAHLFLERTVPGLALRAVGRSPHAAAIAGIRPAPRILLALSLGGAAAGLGAATQVLGSFGRYVEGFSPGWGFAGIAVSMVAGHRPLLILPVALLFGALRSGAFAMDALEVAPRETAAVIESSVLIAAAAAAWARPNGGTGTA